jgi:hypothetical protein
VKGNQGAVNSSTADNIGPVYKEIRPVKLDFSATNFKAKVTGWRLSVEKKADTLFPAVCDCARSIAGIDAASVATVDSTQSEYQDPQILARANLASEDEEDTAAEHEKDERHDNGLRGDDDGNNSGVDDGDHHDNGGDDGHDNGGDNGVGSGEDGGNGGGTNENEEADDENEAEPEGSDLTEIGSSSELEATGSETVEFVRVPASGSRKKEVQHGRR